MEQLTIFAVLSFCALAWTATVPVDLTQKNTDPELVLNTAVPEDEAPSTTESSSKIALQTDSDDSVDSDIYWRLWNGTLPRDALVGAFGMSQCGVEVPSYMAQVLHKGTQPGILPSQLYKRSKFATVSFNRKTYKYKDNVKVLCAEDPNIVTWVPIEDTFNVIWDAEEDCVIAGTELGFTTFFGRTVHEGETIIGKVLYRLREMVFPYYDEEKSVAVNFEVLCYKRAVEAHKIENSKRGEQKKLQEKKAVVVVTTTQRYNGYRSSFLQKYWEG